MRFAVAGFLPSANLFSQRRNCRAVRSRRATLPAIEVEGDNECFQGTVDQEQSRQLQSEPGKSPVKTTRRSYQCCVGSKFQRPYGRDRNRVPRRSILFTEACPNGWARLGHATGGRQLPRSSHTHGSGVGNSRRSSLTADRSLAPYLRPLVPRFIIVLVKVNGGRSWPRRRSRRPQDARPTTRPLRRPPYEGL